MMKLAGRTMKRGSSGFVSWEAAWAILLIVVLIVILAAILFPVFAKVDMRPIGVVVDAANQPVPGVTLRFRDATGRIVASLPADAQGQFRRRGLQALSRDAIDGYALTRAEHNTGAPRRDYFSPLVTQQAVFQGASGRTVSGFRVTVAPVLQSWQVNPLPQPVIKTVPKTGLLPLTNVPASARFTIQSADPDYVITGVQTSIEQATVRYTVTVRHHAK